MCFLGGLAFSVSILEFRAEHEEEREKEREGQGQRERLYILVCSFVFSVHACVCYVFGLA